MILWKALQEENYRKLKERAAFFGVDLDKEAEKNKEDSMYLFKDPKEYEKMTVEERQKLTDKMMSQHKGWAEKARMG